MHPASSGGGERCPPLTSRVDMGWWRDVVVMRLIRSTKLLYAGPG